jgi:sugar/nucleoside kinase (ribokinase family)
MVNYYCSNLLYPKALLLAIFTLSLSGFRYEYGDVIKAVSGVIELTDYLIMNSDEGAHLTGFKDYRKQNDLLAVYGAKNVVVKLGAGGPYLRNREVEFRAKSYPIEIEDADDHQR